METWRTAIVNATEGQIRVRGYDITSLMTRATFTDTIYLLHRGELPSPDERALLDAILVGVSDSRFRRSLVRHGATGCIR